MLFVCSHNNAMWLKHLQRGEAIFFYVLLLDDQSPGLNKVLFSCPGQVDSFPLAQWARAQLGSCPPTNQEFIISKPRLAQRKQNLRAHCPRGKLEFKSFFSLVNEYIYLNRLHIFTIFSSPSLSFISLHIRVLRICWYIKTISSS